MVGQRQANAKGPLALCPVQHEGGRLRVHGGDVLMPPVVEGDHMPEKELDLAPGDAVDVKHIRDVGRSLCRVRCKVLHKWVLQGLVGRDTLPRLLHEALRQEVVQ